MYQFVSLLVISLKIHFSEEEKIEQKEGNKDSRNEFDFR